MKNLKLSDATDKTKSSINKITKQSAPLLVVVNDGERWGKKEKETKGKEEFNVSSNGPEQPPTSCRIIAELGRERRTGSHD